MRTKLPALAAIIGICGITHAGEAIDYLRDVKPILTRRCVACHGALKQKSGLRVDTAAHLLHGGESGPAVVAGKSSESLIVEAVAGADGWKMPPEGEGERLSNDEIVKLKGWIDSGATAPTETEPPDPRDHWSLRAPKRPEIPTSRDMLWVRNPVDAFLAAGYEAHGLQPVTPADKGVLARRIYLDLTGIAPTPAELREFLADSTENAYEKLVDRLLDSPRYGERWGRHWMDVWRYSDWDGYGAEVRESQPHIWRWRDWIVESLNKDVGYDRMITAMLAADEAAPGDESEARATGFLVRNWYKFSRNVWLDNIVEHTSKAFLGLTLNCARCHDHKYDPITQQDYYRFRAFFEPHEIRTDRVPGQADTAKNGLVRVYDAKLDAPTYLFKRGDEKSPDTTKPLSPAIPEVFGIKALNLKPVALPAETSYPGLRKYVRDETLAAAQAELEKSRAAFEKAKGKPDTARAEKALASAQAALTATEARLLADSARFEKKARPEAELLGRLAAAAERQALFLKADEAIVRAEADLNAARVALKSKPADSKAKKAVTDAEAKRTAAQQAVDAARLTLAKVDGAYTPVSAIYPSTSTGRRLALARWIASRENPLTARVAVNHIWMRHFGAPLVPSVSDFGNNGKRPTNPALLDWLAVEFMDKGWSFKTLHRWLVTSNAYRMKSTSDGASASNLAADPANLYFWKMNPRRMEAEAVRDNVLAASGTLDRAMGGPDLDPEAGQSSGRRSLYFRHAKEKRMTFLKMFDSPSVVSCYRRSESVVPQQALALANSPLALQQARLLAKALAKDLQIDSNTDATINGRFLNAAFERILGREPMPEERAECLRFLETSSKLPAERVRADLVHVLFNHNDFVTVR